MVIQVENLGKKYRLRHQVQGRRYVALRDVIADNAKRLARGAWRRARTAANPPSPFSSAPGPNLSRTEDFWALKDVSFEVQQGDVLGVIGRNGAGKSTLLKILSRITEPTEGRVRLRGRVASLLEVGTGFHPELTGRENIFLNGAILGMTRAEITRKFDEIVAFAEVEKFLDTPVKRYSSGMYVRLAFAVAAHLEPEILIIDEVLAVGDAQFQKKCLGKMGEVAKGGRTVLFVSHNMAAVQALCSKAIILSGGGLLARGETAAMIQLYLQEANRTAEVPLLERKDREGSGALRFCGVELSVNDEIVPAFQCGADSSILFRVRNSTSGDLRNVSFSIGIDDEVGQRILLLDSAMVGDDFAMLPTGDGQVKIRIPRLCLAPGHYRFTLFATVNGIIADWIKGAGGFDVEGGDFFGTGQLPPRGQGIVLTPHTFAYTSAASGTTAAAGAAPARIPAC